MRRVLLTLALVLTSTSVMARSYFLPDYQGAGLERRIQDTDKQNNITTCSPYGLYNSIQSGMTCSVVYPASGLTCYTCSCDSVYKYSSADCPTPSYILSDQCKGKYKSCSCDTTLYPTTSATGGCQYGFIPDINNYCEDKPDATKHYACVKPVCKPDNITVEDCQAQGDGHNCTASKEANCTDYCDSNGCQDNCAYLTQTGQARSDCRYGCAAGKEVSGCADLCYECAAAPESPTNTCADIYDGKSNTTGIISQQGADALVATAANQYYVGDKNGDFGQGKWYLPSIGELVDMYGVDPDQITSGSGNTGATGGYLKEINDVLTTLYDKGIVTDILSDSYWSSSEHSADHVWTLTASSANGSGSRSYALKDYSDHTYVRPFLEIEKCFNAQYNYAFPAVGLVMYDDKTWGSADEYYSGSSKKPVGIIASVDKTDNSVKIISLKNLTFSTTDSSGNFDADNPYGGKYEESVWAPYDKREVNVTAVPNYSSDKLKTMLKTCATKEKPICPFTNAELSGLFDGKSNTQKIVAQLGNTAAAYATTQFYVGDKNGAFGQGNWYLPAIGELIDMYGIDTSKMTYGTGGSGAVGDNKAIINAALKTLQGKGADAQALTNDVYWSSSEAYEANYNYSWGLSLNSGKRYDYYKFYTHYVRPSQLLENCFNPAGSGGAAAPKIGDVMYADKTWGSATDYDGSKQAVGIVSAVGNDGSVKIISLKDLTFSSNSGVGNFDPDDPYGGTENRTQWILYGKISTDVVGVPNYSADQLKTMLKKCATLRLCSGSTIAGCEASGDGYRCIASTEEGCSNYCASECMDMCRYEQVVNNMVSNCQYGCAVGKEVSGCPDLCYECAAASCADVYDGKSNTKAAVNQLGKEALAAWAADNFYVGDKNGAFGQGQWYLPAIGEWMDFYGTDVSKMTDGDGNTGAVGDNKAKINAALNTLRGKGADAEALTNGYYWSSSEGSNRLSWILDPSGYRYNYGKAGTNYVRACQLLENCFDPTSGSTPKIGDVMYADKTWGSAEDYDGSKQAVGIVSAVGNDGSVKIISLKDLTFSSKGSAGNFNPDDLYGGTKQNTQWATDAKDNKDVVDIPNYDSDALLTAFKSCRE